MLTEDQVACLDQWPDFSDHEYQFERFGYSAETKGTTREEALIQVPGVGGNVWNWNCAHSFFFFSIAMAIFFFSLPS